MPETSDPPPQGGSGGGGRSRGHLDTLTCPVAGVEDNNVLVRRLPVTQLRFDELHHVQDKPRRTFCQVVRSKLWCDKRRLWKLTSSYVPVVKFLRYYRLREYAITDVMAGLCVGILHIPQALAFGSLVAVKIENSMCTSLWPVLFYVFFGTSPHVSMGTSAVVAIMTGSVVSRQGEQFLAANHRLLNLSAASADNETEFDPDTIPEFMEYKVNIAMGVTMVCGLIMVIMGLLKLGFITWYLSDSFFSAFTSAAAIHIATSQVPAMLGLRVPRHSGVFKIVRSYGAIFAIIHKINIGAVICALITCVVILVVKDCINERFKHRLPVPIPVELFVVILGSLAGYFGDLKSNYRIENVGSIPTSIRMPAVPDLSEASSYVVDGFVLAIIIFAYTIAMAKICAKKHSYEVNDSQEMIAYGLCNFASSFFHCFPSCVAPPRTMVSSQMNTKTTLSGLFAFLLMLLVTLVISFCFEPLPRAVLAAIVFIALKGLFVQISDGYKYWRINKFDFVIWLCTLVSVVLLDIDIGLGIGVGVSLITVVLQSQFSRGYRLGRTPNDSALVEHKRYPDSREIPGVKIFRFQGNLYFANAEIFRNHLFRKTVNPRKLLKALNKRKAKIKRLGLISKNGDVTDFDPENPPATGHLNGSASFVSQEQENSPGITVFTVGANPVFTMNDEIQNGQSYNAQNDTFGVLSDGEMKNVNGVAKVRDTVTDDKLEEKEEEEDPDDGDVLFTDERLREMRKVRYLIIDCAPINYLDTSGANMLSSVFGEFAQVGITVFLAHCCHDVRLAMEVAGVYTRVPRENVFLELEDAVARARLEQVLSPERLAVLTQAGVVEEGDMVTKF